MHLDEVMTNFAIMVTQTSQYLEVRSQGCTKARIVSVLLNRLRMESNALSSAGSASSKTELRASGLPGFVLCLGTEQTNPSIFNATATVYSDALLIAASKAEAVGSTLATKSRKKTTDNEEAADVSTTPVSAAAAGEEEPAKLSTNGRDSMNTIANSGAATHESAVERGHATVAPHHRAVPSAVLAKDITGNIGRLASIGVFTCFYGGQQKRESTDADFYVDSETDLRKILRGIVKLSDAGMQ